MSIADILSEKDLEARRLMHTIEEIAALLQIHAQASAHGDALRTIAAAAYSRLIQINGEMSQDSFMEEGTHQPEAEPQPAPAPEPVTEVHTEQAVVEESTAHRRYATTQEEPTNGE